ncbi:MAG: hypothetical protein U9Q91_00445 [Candidatus Marinimicrobia bacterium]|nr:hypothetical protein [Candidatus Neomarinimicrobiota bacterium]
MGTDFNRELIIELLKKGPAFRILTEQAKDDLRNELRMSENECISFIIKSLETGVELHYGQTELEKYHGRDHWWFTKETKDNILAYIKVQIDSESKKIIIIVISAHESR